MESSGGGHPRGPLLLACVGALLLHTPLLWWARDATGALSAGHARHAMVVEVLRPTPVQQLAAPPPEPSPAPSPEPQASPAPPQASPDNDATDSSWMAPEQLQAASIELTYPDALLPGGQLTLRWWLRLGPDGSVLALRSNADAGSPEHFVIAAEHALQAARFGPALLGPGVRPEQLCLELRYQETEALSSRVLLRRLHVKDGATRCLGTAPP